MDDKTVDSSRVDAVLRGVIFYPRSSHAGSHLKTSPDLQMKTAVHTGSSPGAGACSVPVHRKIPRPVHKAIKQSERRIDNSKSKIVERQPKSVESLRLTSSKYRLIRKPKYNLLPYKRGQIKLCENAKNMMVRNGTLNSELVAGKENNMYSENSSGAAVKEKCTTGGSTSRRFFKASFGKRRQFTLNMRGLSTGHNMRLNGLKRRERNTALKNKQLCINATSISVKPESEPLTEDHCEHELSAICNVDTSTESLFEDEACKNTEAAVETKKASVENDSSHGASNTSCALTDGTSADVEQCSGVTSTSDTMMGHSGTSLESSASQLYSDKAVTSPSLKHGLGLSSYVIRTSRWKSEDAFHKATKKDKEQMLLDFGQKLHETVNCGVCGMTYIRCEPVDELTHSQYHQTVFATLKFTGWRKTAVVHDFDDGSCVIVVNCDDKRSCRRVEEIKKLVDRELGYIVEGSLSSHSKTYLYVSSTHVIGFCLAQHITRGYRLLSPDDCDAEETRSRARSCCCSEEPVPARCGISRIWVLASERRKNVASRLLDVVRGDFLMGYPVAKDELAFSDPTPDGIKFATRYSGTSSFLVYKTAA